MQILMVAIASIILSVAAQFLLKAGMSSVEIKQAISQPLTIRLPWIIFTNKFIFGGFFLYGLGAIVWLKVLATWDVSKAYPLVGLGFGLTVLVGMVLGESITMFRILGILLICEGVWLIANS
jgi:multidrug transporter EmrE-like cation transporter